MGPHGHVTGDSDGGGRLPMRDDAAAARMCRWCGSVGGGSPCPRTAGRAEGWGAMEVMRAIAPSCSSSGTSSSSDSAANALSTIRDADRRGRSSTSLRLFLFTELSLPWDAHRRGTRTAVGRIAVGRMHTVGAGA